MRELTLEEVAFVTGALNTAQAIGSGLEGAGIGFDVAGFPEIGIPLDVIGFFVDAPSVH
ncbi:MAG TPA: hypothetical protein PK677_13605 [Acidiphilium sp.]|nr:hypothetical protein [Acidiphilium sp.]HQU25007.1 hypothetical protein [Acidiphilium sp.]